MGLYSDGISVMGGFYRYPLRKGRKILIYDRQSNGYLPSQIRTRDSDGYIADAPWNYSGSTFLRDSEYGKGWALFAHRGILSPGPRFRVMPALWG